MTTTANSLNSYPDYIASIHKKTEEFKEKLASATKDADDCRARKHALKRAIQRLPKNLGNGGSYTADEMESKRAERKELSKNLRAAKKKLRSLKDKMARYERSIKESEQEEASSERFLERERERHANAERELGVGEDYNAMWTNMW